MKRFLMIVVFYVLILGLFGIAMFFLPHDLFESIQLQTTHQPVMIIRGGTPVPIPVGNLSPAGMPPPGEGNEIAPNLDGQPIDVGGGDPPMNADPNIDNNPDVIRYKNKLPR